jgi:hypothetical protein
MKKLPLPHKTIQKPVLANVEVGLLEAIKREAKRQGITVTDVITWGLRQYLAETNPREAERLGIRPAA